MRKLLPFLRPYRYWVAAKLLSTSLNAANDIFLVYVMNILVNASLAADKSQLLRSILYMAASVLAGIVLNFMETYSSGRYSAYAARDMKQALNAHLGTLPVPYLETRHSADLITRMSSGIAAIEAFLNGTLGFLLFNAIRVLVSLIAMLILNVQLLLLCSILLPLMAFLTHYLSRPLKTFSTRLQTNMALTNAVAQDAIRGIQTVRAYNLSPTFVQKFQAALERMLHAALAIEKRKAALDAVGIFVKTAPFLLFFLFGGYLVVQGQFTAGGLVAFAMLLMYLVNAMAVLPNQIGQTLVTAGIAGQLFEVLDEAPERQGGSRAERSQAAPAVVFDRVSFSYDGVKPVLVDVSFCLPPSKTIALVGASGSGKSTLFNLICGFHSPGSGTITLFDRPLNEWELSYARSQISLVSQETFLFSGSIADNIACGNSDYSMNDVMEAARQANIHAYIESLPEGYATQVGERGVKLSGGQRQRISIARAMLKNAPILLLDEATSALDVESEKLVQAAVTRVMAGKTVLIVAHRLSTILHADEILVLEQGRIVERGTHGELMAADGPYKRLYSKQLGDTTDWGKLPEGEERGQWLKPTIEMNS